jgi:hypothetical protein
MAFVEAAHQSSVSINNLRRDPGKPGKPLDDGLKPGGSGEIWGIGSEEGGSGTCGLGPGNME